jgi:hypothetical protein
MNSRKHSVLGSLCAFAPLRLCVQLLQLVSTVLTYRDGTPAILSRVRNTEPIMVM